MAYKDNRDFIKALSRTGDVVPIKQELDWNLEVGAIVRMANEKREAAPFFEKIKDYPEGFRIFGGPLATERRLAVSMGLSLDSTGLLRNIQKEYELRVRSRIKPVVVSKAPCKENVLMGDEVDLFLFPAPMIHEGDGGRYLGSWHMVITKDLDSDWVNWGMYRLMVYNRRILTSICESYSHMHTIKAKYEYQKRPMPVAIAIGADPISSFAAATQLGIGRSEADFASALRQEPVELIKCETNDLFVPAHAEIVLEGELIQGTKIAEGPFGEYTGYRSTPRQPQIAYKINAITHRNNPIVTMSCTGMPVDDTAIVVGLTNSVAIKRHLQRHGVPVTDVYVPPETECYLVIVGVKPNYSNAASVIANTIFSTSRGTYKVIIVDADVDVFDLNQVLHAFATKCHPVRGIRVSDREAGQQLTPFLSTEEKVWREGASVAFDCTWPFEWSKESEVPVRISFDEAYPEEVKQKVTQNWRTYGFKV
jgi:phenylphosphate carboxylase alpha subunit